MAKCSTKILFQSLYPANTSVTNGKNGDKYYR